MIREALTHYEMYYADLIQQGASPLVAHTEAIFWALDQLEAHFGKRSRARIANTLRDAALAQRKAEGDL